MDGDTRAERNAEQWDPIENTGVLDASDTLDDDKVPDPLDVGVIAPDHWSGADRYGTTVAEQRAGESLDQLLAQEEPDVDPYAEDPEDDDELIRRGYETEPRAGRLVAEDAGFGEGRHTYTVAWDVGIDAGAASAEEAAMHIVMDPDGRGDGPLP